ncbi:MAG: hypothetical protein R3F62_02485 [Planctomycetota bacterium]
MDLEAIWQTHKPFIIKVGVGALLFAILAWYQGSVTASAVALERSNAGNEGKLVAKLNDLEGAEGLEKGRHAALDKDLKPAVLGVLGWTSDPEFVLPQGDRSPRLFYAAAVTKAVERVSDAAATWNAEVPRDAASLGLPVEVDDALVPEALARLDVIERVVRILLDAGVRRISDLRPEQVAYVSPQGLGGHLRAVPFEVSFSGGPSVLQKALKGLTEEGSFVEVLGCRVERTGEGPQAGVEVTLSAQALALVDAIPEAAKSQTQSSGGGGRGRRRRGRRVFGKDR